MFFAFLIGTFVSDTYTSSRFLYGERKDGICLWSRLRKGNSFQLSNNVHGISKRRHFMWTHVLRESSVSEKMDVVKSRV